MIDGNHALSISRQAQLAGISRGSVYYLPKTCQPCPIWLLMRRIDALHLEHPFMGARMLRDQLNREGYDVGRKHVGTLMKRMGIEALYRKPGTSKKHPGHEIYPYLLRGLTINRANQVWALDTTYIPMAKGFVYLTAVVDWACRGLGSKGSDHAGGLPCGRCAARGIQPPWQAGNCEHRPRQPVHRA